MIPRSQYELALVRQIRRLLIVGICAMVALTVAVWWTSFHGRTELVSSQRNGCMRGKLDRAANAQGWREAERARRRDGQPDVARVYARIATGLEARARVDCAVAFPDPGPFAVL